MKEKTHKSTPIHIKRKAGIQESLVRLSCGIEDVEDLILDIQQALVAVRESNFALKV